MIEIDAHKLAVGVAASLPHTADLQRALRTIGAAAREHWVTLAKRELHTTAQDYIKGIQDIQSDGMRVTISLVGVVPNMVEQGWDARDLRETLLGPNSRAKTSADGNRYNVIPFRHGTPGSGGRNVGKPMPRPIHNVAKAMEATLSRPGGLSHGPGGHTVAYGDRLHPGMTMSRAARKILGRKERPHHKSSIYMGMIRQEKTYRSSAQPSYHTFRTISSRVREGWMHPGITPRLLHRKVEKHVSKIQGALIRAATKP